MSRYRKVEVRTWSDAKFCRLSPMPPSGQGLWLFLMTGPHTGPIPGLFRAGRAAMAEELGWSPEAFGEAFAEVSGQGMVEADFKAKIVWMPKAIRHNKPESPNVVRGWRAEIELLPECALKDRALSAMRECMAEFGAAYLQAFSETYPGPVGGDEGLTKGYGEAFREGSRQDMPESGTGTGTGTGQNQNQTRLSILSTGQGSLIGADASPMDAPELEPSEPEDGKPGCPEQVRAVFAYWQQALGHGTAKLGDCKSKRYRAIRARLRDGYTVDALFSAIDGCSRSPYHMGRDPKGNPSGTVYDDIELICRDGGKVDKFIRIASAPIARAGLSAAGRATAASAEEFLRGDGE